MLKHRVDFKTTEKDFNEKGNIKLSSLLYFCQEAATQHAELIGVGMDDLLKENIIWVVVKMKVRVLAKMMPDQDYYVMTYPRQQKSRYYPRDYYIFDKDGNQVAVGASIWSLVNWETRKMVRRDLPFGDDLREDESIPEGFEKIRMKDPADAGSYTVAETDIDANGHCNNCSYGDMVELVADTEGTNEFLIQFSKETKLSEMILLHRQDAEEGVMVSGSLPDGETVFLAKLTTK